MPQTNKNHINIQNASVKTKYKSNITHLNPSKIRELLNDDKLLNSIEKIKVKFAYKSKTQCIKRVVLYLQNTVLRL